MITASKKLLLGLVLASPLVASAFALAVSVAFALESKCLLDRIDDNRLSCPTYLTGIGDTLLPDGR